MKAPILDEELMNKIHYIQKKEITHYHIYLRLSKSVAEKSNREILEKIANDEKRHCEFWKNFTNCVCGPNHLEVFFYYFIARIFGLTFGIKLMERSKEESHIEYEQISKYIPDAKKLVEDAEEQELILISMISEDKLKYVGSVILGLSDAVVELTGALAGFTLALQDTKLVALTGMITGISAALSMAASEYLATKTENKDKRPLKAAIYTGVTYLATVSILVAPFLFLEKIFLSLSISIFSALVIISIFTFYISVAQEKSFRHRFTEMSVISLGVATISFTLGYAARVMMGF